jgi:F-type H+-transporting ATPase subunit b
MLRSPFALPEDLRESLAQGVRQALGQQVEMHYQDQTVMPLGIELMVGGLKLSWGVDSYFEQLERDVATLYDGQTANPSEVSS